MLPFQNCLSGKIRIRNSHAEKKNIKMSDLFKLNLVIFIKPFLAQNIRCFFHFPQYLSYLSLGTLVPEA